ncbi:S49 family peptidase [Pararhodobacter zhoushanensis]|uniref:S49 family peptidase n=1 Tax=Pararhodobacter zhoushanensis TaxID=2479545 RepID=UPI000F8F3B91|nr:S49 family peptidase [Pararhodobacter zhoushanensis]
MPDSLQRVLGAIHSHPWAIMPDYLAAIEAIAMRAFETGALAAVAEDGHQARLAADMTAIAATGTPLAGATMSTVRDGTAVIPVFGPIFPRATMLNSSAGGTSLDGIMRDFRVAQADADVSRIVLMIDSPGGVVSGLGEAAAAIRGSAKPVTAFVTGLGASAAYWLASQASEIVLDSSAQVGSIGVAFSMSRQVQPGADGRMNYEIVSSNAPNKRPDPTTDDGLAALQSELDGIESVFHADVAKGRKVSVATVRSEFGRGATVAARRAVELGMADKIGTLEGVLKGARGAGGKVVGGQRARLAAEMQLRRLAAQ